MSPENRITMSSFFVFPKSLPSKPFGLSTPEIFTEANDAAYKVDNYFYEYKFARAKFESSKITGFDDFSLQTTDYESFSAEKKFKCTAERAVPESPFMAPFPVLEGHVGTLCDERVPYHLTVREKPVLITARDVERRKASGFFSKNEEIILFGKVLSEDGRGLKTAALRGDFQERLHIGHARKGRCTLISLRVSERALQRTVAAHGKPHHIHAGAIQAEVSSD